MCSWPRAFWMMMVVPYSLSVHGGCQVLLYNRTDLFDVGVSQINNDLGRDQTGRDARLALLGVVSANTGAAAAAVARSTAASRAGVATMAAAHSRSSRAAVALDGALTDDLVQVVRCTLGARRRRRVVVVAVWVAGRGLAILAVIILAWLISGPGRRRRVADQRAGLRTTVENVTAGSTVLALTVFEGDLALEIAGEVVGIARLLIGRSTAVIVAVALIVAIALLYIASASAHVVAVILDDAVANMTAAVAVAITVTFVVTIALVVEAVLFVTVAAAHGGRQRLVAGGSKRWAEGLWRGVVEAGQPVEQTAGAGAVFNKPPNRWRTKVEDGCSRGSRGRWKWKS